MSGLGHSFSVCSEGCCSPKRWNANSPFVVIHADNPVVTASRDRRLSRVFARWLPWLDDHAICDLGGQLSGAIA